ncbi:DUF4194 domain-containing protein [Pseudomonas aeruginosa]|uniref:DUF4194 domain-containing protein n=1 Tax=Pseudomonas aeruginosa group TaxID=136841 RepID=UPI00053E179D|nr:MULTISPECIES: DUF4194 domain-containing protein [Pseudomonas aeruginosa group]AVE36235.1 DUF4194 domain-containing protein [Pseudomonas aeruginosa]EKX6390549.1 DUF4194 domain-containing protein [Pseudomonas aeruginosa]ELB6600249.1 DUF4194 domain-containing protein [Pseudomonas aeruginosa]ELC8338272.1 DUF4194 domain-containing protein [Pseudomonas aeruginosa]ELH7227046.1 DUF4194 domain-containing protein [Pseudomonas aeruginosa]
MNEEEQHSQQAPALFDQYRTNRPETPSISGEVETFEDAPVERPVVGGAEVGMPLEARRALVLLLRQGVVMAESKRLAFEALCRHEVLIAEHLGNMFMRMLLDMKAGIAILLQQEVAEQDEETDEASRLINKRTLSLYDTLLLLVLRKYYQERETAGEQKIIIDIERIEALMTPFLPLTYSSRSERRTLNGSLALLKDKRLISAVRGDDERFEITSVIRYVVNADFLERLLKEYERLAGNAGVKTGDEVQDA